MPPKCYNPGRLLLHVSCDQATCAPLHMPTLAAPNTTHGVSSLVPVASKVKRLHRCLPFYPLTYTTPACPPPQTHTCKHTHKQTHPHSHPPPPHTHTHTHPPTHPHPHTNILLYHPLKIFTLQPRPSSVSSRSVGGAHPHISVHPAASSRRTTTSGSSVPAGGGGYGFGEGRPIPPELERLQQQLLQEAAKVQQVRACVVPWCMQTYGKDSLPLVLCAC